MLREDIAREHKPKKVYSLVIYQYDTVTLKERHMQEMHSNGWKKKSSDQTAAGYKVTYFK